MTFADALTKTRMAYAQGLAGHPLTEVDPWWDASESLGLLHRARVQAERAPHLSAEHPLRARYIPLLRNTP